MKNVLFGILLLLLCSSCATNFIQVNVDVSPPIMQQIVDEYNPVVEKGFCVSLDKGVYNVVYGNPIFSTMPLCNRSDIVMHTHPVWGEPWASFIDDNGWSEYQTLYGNLIYGIVGVGWVKFYVRG